ncbi:hypothetical protein QVD17_42285 [Tagetes erecta]|uniref:Secreted protein n=1 Tax=Tagetes erecta TaxID=13708 RepID=A0AAD8JLK7_TARER|nr:hypothetical protein QVD17_42285 [Tagetes erecta]
MVEVCGVISWWRWCGAVLSCGGGGNVVLSCGGGDGGVVVVTVVIGGAQSGSSWSYLVHYRQDSKYEYGAAGQFHRYDQCGLKHTSL